MKPRLFLSLLFIAVSLVSTVLLGTPAFAQNQTDTDGKTIEQATKAVTPELERMTFRVVFDGDDCIIPEKFDVISLSKCEMIKGIPHMTISVLPRHVSELMFKMDSGIFESRDQFKMDMTTFYKILGYQIQKNNVISERALGNDVKDVEDKLVRAILYMEKGQCDFPKELNVKLIDTDCKPLHDYIQYPYQIAVDVPVSKLLELEKLDYVKKIDDTYLRYSDFIVPNVVIESSTNNIEQGKTESSTSNNQIEPTIIESDTNDYTPYILILIIIPVSVVITLFWRLRKKAKIEA